MTRRGLLLTSVITALLVGPAVAQTGGGPPGAPPGGGPPHHGGREELFKALDAYLLENLQRSLDLSDEALARLRPLVERLQETRREHARRRTQTLREMRRLLESGTATEPKIAELVQELRTQEREQPAEMFRAMEAVDAALTPVQQAKFRLLEMRMTRQLQELMGRRRRRGPGPGPPPARDGGEPDDDEGA
ncbi:MAG TPA: hypothetical protein VIC87_13360 [Vicinamibacteria bacterium]